MIDLSGQTALVTGGSRGIGRAVTLALARAGADVALTFHTRADEAESTAREVQAAGRRVFVGGGDLGDAEVVERLLAGVKREFGGLDIFVANAGVWPAEEIPLAEMPLGRWRRTMVANLDSVFLSTRAALALIRPGGRVVIVSSTAGQRGEAYHADYAATKGALIALTKSLAVEYAGRGIRVNAVSPGVIKTPMHKPETHTFLAGLHPLGRMGEVREVVEAVLYLESAAFVTGETLHVDGGAHAGRW